MRRDTARSNANTSSAPVKIGRDTSESPFKIRIVHSPQKIKRAFSQDDLRVSSRPITFSVRPTEQTYPKVH